MGTKRSARQDILHFDSYASEVGGKLTYIGALQQCQKLINKRWNADTRKTYYKHYEERLFPLIPEKPLEELTEADFEAVIETMNEQALKNGNPYSDSQIRHHRHLLRVVTKAAEQEGICPDILWGGNFLEDESDEHEAKIKVKPRSLSTGEEYRICERVLQNPQEEGELVGIAIMFCLGTRNQEACGLNWESFAHQPGDDMGFLRVIASTEQGSNRVKAGGKTRNAPRILPVTGLLLDLLVKRRQWLEEMSADGLVLDHMSADRITDIARLPIVCRDTQYTVRAGADDLTRKAKALLKEINLDEDVLEEANELLEQRFALSFGERDVTAYLFRRNFATHMSILGLDAETIHYLMGHAFEDEEITKARYTNNDILRQIGEQMRQRPIVNPKIETEAEITLLPNQSISGKGQGPLVFRIEAGERGSTVTGYLKPTGASKLGISLEYEQLPESGEIILSPEQFHTEPTVSEKVTYRKIYGRRRDKRE